MSGLEGLIYRSERWMYRSGHPNRVAAVLNRLWANVGARGLWPGRLVSLEVRGRRSGRPISFPLIVATYAGERYLVAMLGERADWVANVRAAGGRAVLSDGRRLAVRLQEVERTARAPIVRRHLDVAPAARSWMPGDWRTGGPDFEDAATRLPVFRVVPVGATNPASGDAR